MTWVYDHAPDDLKPSEMLTLLVLADHANDDGGLSYPSVGTLSRKTRLGERTVQTALKTLCERAIIRKQMEANGPRPDVYCFPTFRGAGFAGVNHRDNPVTPAKNDTLPPQIFPKKTPTPIKENRPIEPSSLGAQAPKKGSRLPDDWEPDESLKAWALDDLGVSEDYLTYQTDQFCDYWHAKAGQQAIKLDWDLTFRSWMRKAKEEYGGKRSSSNGRALNNDEKRPIPSGLPDVLQEPRREMSPEKLAELRALRGKS